ncbi:protein of unknown function [Chitinophaga costaii]|uniref:DUF4407 domain-containing protein n=1 Tax=Chitinophaga costaii TaxID=1335309 RepID=A0A1C4DBA7_9BACT|nr:DUF4407 domain-containing protein [Chitinophaga costaii]PUZ24548.1 DUF4407 domain-containing protein [Chitinophaga costaii]SCC28667.1 protein of unknown function [Chitinophaga costaii]
MQRIRQFFLFCSGAHPSMLRRAPADTNKYGGIGGTIFFTGLLAALSAGYALWTVFEQAWSAILFGAIWGLMIFNLDRYIVSGMKKRARFGQELLLALPRIILAVLIAVVISKPLELKIFEKEIHAELLSMEQQVYKQQEDLVKARYAARSAELRHDIDTLQGAITTQAARRDGLMLLAQQEADGTGGSRVKNLGPIYKAKKTDADKASADLQHLDSANTAQIRDKQHQLAAIDSSMKADIMAMGRGRLDGLASRLDALGHITERSTPIRWANGFIMLLFIALETAPVFVKLISLRGPYDDLLEQHEFNYEMERKDRMAHRRQQSEERKDIREQTRAQRVQAAIDKEHMRQQANLDVEKAKTEHWQASEIEKL